MQCFKSVIKLRKKKQIKKKNWKKIEINFELFVNVFYGLSK